MRKLTLVLGAVVGLTVPGAEDAEAHVRFAPRPVPRRVVAPRVYVRRPAVVAPPVVYPAQPVYRAPVICPAPPIYW